LIDSIFAVVALEYLACLLIPLGRTPGAGRNARFAAYAQSRIDEYDPIMHPLLHGTGRTCRDTPGGLAVKAGHEYEVDSGNAAYQFRTYGDDHTESRADRQIVFGLAVHFTGFASNTPFLVLI
jgi:hypothetical protein